MNKVILRNNLKQLRRNLKLSQQQIADRCFITVRTYVDIENGKREPGAKLSILIARAVNERMDKVFYLAMDPKTKRFHEGQFYS